MALPTGTPLSGISMSSSECGSLAAAIESTPPDIARQLGERSKVHLGFDQRGSMLPGQFGFTIGGSTHEGYRLSLACIPAVDTAVRVPGPLIRPDAALHSIRFDYDPRAGDAGRVTAKLDEEVLTMDLDQEQRDAGATFDLLGLTSPRQGGKWVTLYLDDLEYTVARNRDRTRCRQEVTQSPLSGRREVLLTRSAVPRAVRFIADGPTFDARRLTPDTTHLIPDTRRHTPICSMRRWNSSVSGGHATTATHSSRRRKKHAAAVVGSRLTPDT